MWLALAVVLPEHSCFECTKVEQNPVQLQLTQQMQITADRCSKASHECSWYVPTYSHLLTAKLPEQLWGCRSGIPLTLYFLVLVTFPLPTASTCFFQKFAFSHPGTPGRRRGYGAVLTPAAGYVGSELRWVPPQRGAVPSGVWGWSCASQPWPSVQNHLISSPVRLKICWRPQEGQVSRWSSKITGDCLLRVITQPPFQ